MLLVALPCYFWFSLALSKMSIFPKNWGEYPPEYNREIHGPYNPSVYYGKRDTPFGEVKLGELLSWFGRRNKSPRAMAQAISRALFRYHFLWVFPKKPGPAFFYQTVAVISIINFWVDHRRYRSEHLYRYH